MKAWLGAATALPVLLALHGYYSSRLLAALAWLSKSKMPYLLFAAAAFIAQTYFLVANMWRDITPRAKADAVPFIVGGACIVLACSYLGDKLQACVG